MYGPQVQLIIILRRLRKLRLRDGPSRVVITLLGRERILGWLVLVIAGVCGARIVLTLLAEAIMLRLTRSHIFGAENAGAVLAHVPVDDVSSGILGFDTWLARKRSLGWAGGSAQRTGLVLGVRLG